MTTRVRVDVAAEHLWLTGLDDASGRRLQVRIRFPENFPENGSPAGADLFSGFGWIARVRVARLIDWRWIQECRPRPPRRRRRRRGPRLRDGATVTGGGTRLVVLAGGREAAR